MAIDQAPEAIIFLINLIIFFFAVRHPQREGSRVFQMVLGAALFCWSGGMVLYDYSARNGIPNEWVFILPSITTMLVPAAFLSFALSFPTPRPWVERHHLPLVSLYLPPLVLVCLTFIRQEDYQRLAQSYSTYAWTTKVWGRKVWSAYPMFAISAVYLTLAAWIFNRRLRESNDPNDQQLFRWILYCFIGTLTFSVAMLATARTAEGDLYPAPSMVMALIGQLGLFCAVRHLQESAPEEVSRAVLLPLLALAIVFSIRVGYVALTALLNFDILAEWQLEALMLVSVFISLTLVLVREDLQRGFDRFFFNRAYQYRQMMREMHSELREARERLSRAERMAIVGEIAASVAHEIKNPLGPIKGYTQMILRLVDKMPASSDKDRMVRGLNIIGEEVDNINDRVRSLLEFSRSEQLALKPCRISEIVQRAADLARGEALDGKDLQIVMQAEKMLPLTAGDPVRLHEAFFNIIENGIQAMDGRGRIEITINRAMAVDGRNGVQIKVRDQGRGMSLEQTKQAFKTFYTTREGGAGLGLGVVKNAVQAHHGEISIASNPNQGATVTVWLPADETAE